MRKSLGANIFKACEFNDYWKILVANFINSPVREFIYLFLLWYEAWLGTL